MGASLRALHFAPRICTTLVGMKPDLLLHSSDPLVLEGRAELLMGQETPIEHFFVHSRGLIPAVAIEEWRLTWTGSWTSR